MPDRYFSKLPLIVYNKTLCRDISRRAAIKAITPRQSPFMYYPYEIKQHLRPDHIAEYYYDDSQTDWLIFLQNDIIDPYYGWPLDDRDFEQYITDKYTSSAVAQRKVVFYRNNWYNDTEQLSVSYYNNNIAQQWKKYYEPVWGPGVKIIGYQRKREDQMINTNRIVDLGISANNNGNTFSYGDIVDVKLTGFDSAVGTGEIAYSNSSVIGIQHISGNVAANSTVVMDVVNIVAGGANVSVNSSNTIFENVTEQEEVFWSPVSYYQYETELNEQKKQLVLADQQQKFDLIEAFENAVQTDVDSITQLSIDVTDE